MLSGSRCGTLLGCGPRAVSSKLLSSSSLMPSTKREEEEEENDDDGVVVARLPTPIVVRHRFVNEDGTTTPIETVRDAVRWAKDTEEGGGARRRNLTRRWRCPFV